MALEKSKSVVFVYDTDARHGGMNAKQALEYATGQAARAVEDRATGASNVVNNCTGKVSPRQVAAERALIAVLHTAVASPPGDPTALSEAVAERDAADAEAKVLKKTCLDLHDTLAKASRGRAKTRIRRTSKSQSEIRDAEVEAMQRAYDEAQEAISAWVTTEGELLHEWLCTMLPMLLGPVAGGGRPIIPWFRDVHCKHVSLKRIIQEALVASFDPNKFLDFECDGALPLLHIAGETSRIKVNLPPARATITRPNGQQATCFQHLFISKHHPSSAAVREKLEARLPGLACSTEDMLQCTHMLVLLDTGGTGDVQQGSPALNDAAYSGDIIAALNNGLEIISLHVGPSVFNDFMWDKGTALWKVRAHRPRVIFFNIPFLLTNADTSVFPCVLCPGGTLQSHRDPVPGVGVGLRR